MFNDDYDPFNSYWKRPQNDHTLLNMFEREKERDLHINYNIFSKSLID